MREWTERHSRVAESEGWNIFHVGHPDTPYQIQRIDENPILSGDEEAWRLVRRGQGEHHKLALQLIQQHSPGEFELMKMAG